MVVQATDLVEGQVGTYYPGLASLIRPRHCRHPLRRFTGRQRSESDYRAKICTFLIDPNAVLCRMIDSETGVVGRWPKFYSETGMGRVRRRRRSTTPRIPCSPRPTARWRTCAGSWPTRKPPSPSGRSCCGASPRARIRSGPGCCWRTTSRSSRSRARISRARIGGRGCWRRRARRGWRRWLSCFCAPSARCRPS